MKTDRGSVEGQMDIFEAMNRAAAAVELMEAEERNKKKKKPAISAGADKKAEKEKSERVAGRTTIKLAKDKIAADDMKASMQRSFVNPLDDDFATVAYIDYYKVYYRLWNSPAVMKRFDDSKSAVLYYLEQLRRIRELEGIEETTEHEPFVNMQAINEDTYKECE